MLQPDRRQIVFRPTLQPEFPSPTQVRSAGDYQLSPDWRETGRKKWFHQIFWIASGSVNFFLPTSSHQLKRDEVFIYFPGETHKIEPSADKSCHYFWFTLDSSTAETVLKALNLDFRKASVGPVPVNVFERLMSQLALATPQGELEASRLAYDLLTRIAWARRNLRPASNLAEQLRKLIDEEFTQPEINLTALARRLKVHRTTLFRTFRHSQGMTPSSYLQRRRLQQGLALLNQTHLTVEEIALASGYHDSNHFGKAVRNATGKSPTAFRKNPDFVTR